MNVLKREMNELRAAFDLKEILKRAVKYMVEGAAVAVAAFYIPKNKPRVEEAIYIAFTAAATFAILDMWAPSIGNYARQGTGFGIGANLAGFPMRA